MYTAAMNYRVLVVGEGKHFGLSTACLYVTLAGEYGMTDTLEMPRGEYQTETTVRQILYKYKVMYVCVSIRVSSSRGGGGGGSFILLKYVSINMNLAC